MNIPVKYYEAVTPHTIVSATLGNRELANIGGQLYIVSTL